MSRLGAKAARPQTRNHGPVAGTRRSDIPFDEMTKLDYLYVTNWSLREDIRLIMLTIPSLFRVRRAF